MRFPMVSRRIWKRLAFWLVPHMWVKPKKVKVSGFPLPRFFPALGGVAPELDQARLFRV